MAVCSEENTLAGDLLQGARHPYPLELPNLRLGSLARWIVELEDHEGVATAFLSRHAHGGEVDALIGEDTADARDGPRLVARDEHDRPQRTAHLDREAVDPRKAHATRAQRLPHDLDRGPVALERETHGVRVCILRDRRLLHSI